MANSIEDRKKLLEKFSRSLSLHPSEVAVTSIDEIEPVLTAVRA